MQEINNKSKHYHNLVSDLIQSAKESGNLSAAEQRIIDNYLQKKDAEVSPQRYYKTAHYLIRLKTDCKLSNLQTCSTGEVITAFNRVRIIKATPRRNTATAGPDAEPDRTLSRNSINDMQRVIKSFFIWLSKTHQNKNLDLSTLQELKVTRPELVTISEDKILSPDEIKQLFLYCKSKRDNALYRIMYYCALRVGEVCSLKFKDVSNIAELSAALSNNEPIAKPVYVTTDGKTGITRRIPITDRETLYYLNQWYATYPAEITPNSYLFINTNNKPLSTIAIYMQLKRISAKAGISKKEVHPHLIRHSRITHLCKSGLHETYISRIAWGKSSRCLDTYTHLSPDDIAAELEKIDESAHAS